MKGISLLFCVCETRAFPPSCTWPSYAMFSGIADMEAWVGGVHCCALSQMVFQPGKHRLD